MARGPADHCTVVGEQEDCEVYGDKVVVETVKVVAEKRGQTTLLE